MKSSRVRRCGKDWCKDSLKLVCLDARGKLLNAQVHLSETITPLAETQTHRWPGRGCARDWCTAIHGRPLEFQDPRWLPPRMSRRRRRRGADCTMRLHASRGRWRCLQIDASMVSPPARPVPKTTLAARIAWGQVCTVMCRPRRPKMRTMRVDRASNAEAQQKPARHFFQHRRRGHHMCAQPGRGARQGRSGARRKSGTSSPAGQRRASRL